MIAVKVLDSSGNGYASDVLAGLSWIRRQKERLGIRIVNISVGSYAGKYMSEDSALVRGVEAAWDDGLVVVVAAGNHGPANMSVTTPGISRKVITVGCSDDHKKVLVRGNVMVDYSGRGPTAACICKPEIIAPGAKVVSCTNRDGQYSSGSRGHCLIIRKIPGSEQPGCEAAFKRAGDRLKIAKKPAGMGLFRRGKASAGIKSCIFL